MSSFVREHTRYPVELALRMRCGSWNDYLELYTSNLSRGGLFVPSPVTAPIGSEVVVELKLPDGNQLAMRAEVVHLTDAAEARQLGRPPGMGLMFVDLDDTTKRAIEDMVKLARGKVASPPPPAKPAPPPPKPAVPPPQAKPAPTPPQASTPQARAPQFTDAIEHALTDELSRRADLSPHAQLGVSAEASDAEIEEAYQRLRERYAPAIFARYGAATTATVKSINDAIDAAYEKLKDPTQRRALLIAAHVPKPLTEPGVAQQKRRGEEARAALRASIDRRVEEACAHRDMGRVDDAIRVFEAVLEIDRANEYARAELRRLREQKQPAEKQGLFDRLRKR